MATFNALVQKSETPQEALTTLAEWPHSIIGETARHVVRGDYDKNHPLFHGLDTVLKEGDRDRYCAALPLLMTSVELHEIRRSKALTTTILAMIYAILLSIVIGVLLLYVSPALAQTMAQEMIAPTPPVSQFLKMVLSLQPLRGLFIPLYIAIASISLYGFYRLLPPLFYELIALPLVKHIPLGEFIHWFGFYSGIMTTDQEAYTLAARSVSSQRIRKKLLAQSAENTFQERLTAVFKKAALGEAIAIGEMTETLPTVLRGLALNYHNRAKAEIEEMVSIVEPLFIVLVGGLIGGNRSPGLYLHSRIYASMVYKQNVVATFRGMNDV